MTELGLMFFLATFPICRWYWVYRVKARALNTMSLLAKKDIEAGLDWEARHQKFDTEEIDLWRMFFQLHRWTIRQFFSASISCN